METLGTPHAMQAWSDAAHRAGRRIALVPTMGALHAEHLALVAEARRRADRVVVSIFVNPIQFDRRDDFDRYPRTLADDVAQCERAGVDAVFTPAPAAMYPEGFQTGVEVGALTAPLCGRTRQGHFRGVTTVVTKLFHCVRPHVAVFGEKDYQQLAVIRRMNADLNLGVEVIGRPIVRESDGLALSSRNAYLSREERARATALWKALKAVRDSFKAGEVRPDRLEELARQKLAEEEARIDYAEIRDPLELRRPQKVDPTSRLFLAAFLGKTRLIDNGAVGEQG